MDTTIRYCWYRAELLIEFQVVCQTSIRPSLHRPRPQIRIVYSSNSCFLTWSSSLIACPPLLTPLRHHCSPLHDLARLVQHRLWRHPHRPLPLRRHHSRNLAFELGRVFHLVGARLNVDVMWSLDVRLSLFAVRD